MCGARLFAVRVILLQRYKVLPACLPDFGSLPTLIQGARNGRRARTDDDGSMTAADGAADADAP